MGVGGACSGLLSTYGQSDDGSIVAFLYPFSGKSFLPMNFLPSSGFSIQYHIWFLVIFFYTISCEFPLAIPLWLLYTGVTRLAGNDKNPRP